MDLTPTHPKKERKTDMDQIHQDVGIKTLVSQSLDHAAFTDAKNATGYIAFTTGVIPAGSIVLGWKAVISEAFACSSTCTATVGPTGNKDAWTVGDPSVAAIGTVGAPADADVDCFCATATVPYVEVTEDNDFGDVTAGTMVVTIYYLQT
jgi:hypothetical protein